MPPVKPLDCVLVLTELVCTSPTCLCAASYGIATSVACAVSFSLNVLVKRATNMSPAMRTLIQRVRLKAATVSQWMSQNLPAFTVCIVCVTDCPLHSRCYCWRLQRCGHAIP